MTGGGGGGLSRTPVTWSTSSLGVPDRWAEVMLPAFKPLDRWAHDPLPVTDVTLRRAGCDEAFRGVVALRDGRALAIPWCADHFVLVDDLSGFAVAVGPRLLPTLSGEGAFSGGVFGCDGEVLALPWDRSTAMRIGVDEDGNASFTPVPLEGVTGPARLSGGVVARPCAEGFEVLAGGARGLSRLVVWQERIDVTPLTLPDAGPLSIASVARIHDDQFLSSPATTPDGNAVVHVLRTGDAYRPSLLPLTSNPAPMFGAATADDWVFLVSNDAVSFALRPDGTTGAVASVPSTSARWPTSLLGPGFVTSGSAFVHWQGTFGPRTGSAVFDAGVDATSGGLVLLTSGAVLDAPGAGRDSFLLHVPSPPLADPALPLASWFNKL